MRFKLITYNKIIVRKCPFCNFNKLVDNNGYGSGDRYIMCQCCHAKGPNGYYKLQDRVFAWNGSKNFKKDRGVILENQYSYLRNGGRFYPEIHLDDSSLKSETTNK